MNYQYNVSFKRAAGAELSGECNVVKSSKTMMTIIMKSEDGYVRRVDVTKKSNGTWEGAGLKIKEVEVIKTPGGFEGSMVHLTDVGEILEDFFVSKKS